MKLNKMLTALAILSVLPLSACGNLGGSNGRVTLSMSVMYQNANTRMKFGGDSVKFPYQAANGKEYNSGDWKPVWEQVQSDLNINIDDRTDTSATRISGAFQLYQQNGFSGLNIAQGSASDIVAEGTTKGTILKLNEYLDQMPNFKKFLEDNPIVETNIKDGNGDIYYAPYFDGNDDIERMLMVRQDWVEKLLDGSSTTGLETGVTITSAYTPYMPDAFDQEIDAVNAAGTQKIKIRKTYTSGQGVIARQNAKGTLNGVNTVTALREYIDATYPSGTFAKRSDLFCGQNAVYDADELVALFRCVKTNPQFLTGTANAAIVPLFPRQTRNDRNADLWRFAGQVFGVRGLDSRSGYLYVDDEGKINDARDDVATRDAIERMHQMYQEGLIATNFDTESAVTDGNWRNYLLRNNLGFATYDYNQTTTIFNDTIATGSSPISGFLFTSILPAVAKHGDRYIHYTESWRSVKTEGWFITEATKNNEARLERALALFDYFYSPKGNQLMSYGPDAWIEHDAAGNVVTIDYQGKQVPKLSQACITELKTLAGGNYTNYYRYWLGGTYPIGYVKEQGMEYQTVSDVAKPGLDRINKAIQLGVIEHVSSNVVTNTDHLYDMVPTTFAFTAAEQNILGSTYTALSDAFNNENGKTNMWTFIVKYGFDSVIGDTANRTPTRDGYVSYVQGLNVQSFVDTYQDAYARMLA